MWFALLLLAPNYLFARPLVVVLDPGHGGKDRGAVRGDLEESNIVLQIALILEKDLHRNENFRVVMTRRTDHFVSLSARAALARAEQADIFVSLHLNSSTETKAKGAEFYFQNQLPPDEESMFLAARENQEETGEMKIEESLADLKGLPTNNEVRLILDDLVRNDRARKSSELIKTLLSDWRGSNHKSRQNAIKQAPFYVINNVTMPSVLVEIGFLTNPEEAPKLSSPSNQVTIAQGIYRGLVNFKEFIDSHKHAF